MNDFHAPNFVSERSKALIRLGTGCNNNCVFCHSRDGNTVTTIESDDVKKKIRLAEEAGVGMVVFSGGEPTMRKDLPELMDDARALGMELGLITNGRMFYYKKFADQMIDQGLKYALVSLHGSNAEMHNALTGASSFEQTIKGLKNISGRGVNLVVNTVLTKHNAADLFNIHSLLKIFAPVHHKISLPEPKGAAAENFKLILSPEKAAGAVAALLGKFDTTENVSIGFDGFTPCLLNGYFSLKDDFFTHGFYLASEPWEETFFPPSYGNRSYYDICVFCSLRHLCPGIYQGYIDKFTSFSPEPLTRPVSNNIRFLPAEDGLLSGCDDQKRIKYLKKIDPARWIVLKRNEQLEFYRTDEAQTDRIELLKIKYECEQVYLNNGEYEEGTNRFPEHLEKFQLTKECIECESLPTCPGIYQSSSDNVFDKLGERVKQVIQKAKGRVLEIGFGDGPYFCEVRESIKNERILEYIGIDPTMSSEGPMLDFANAKLLKTAFEDFEWDGELFDTILMLRSYHHLRDLMACVDKISSLITHGGRLIIIEDYKHIELRNIGRDEKSLLTDGYQHFRNHSSGDAINIFSEYGFIVENEASIDKGASATWIISMLRNSPL